MAVDKRERDLLVQLIEECSEVQKCATKILRFGASRKKRHELAAKCGDAEAIITLLCNTTPMRASVMYRSDARRQKKVREKWREEDDSR